MKSVSQYFPFAALAVAAATFCAAAAADETNFPSRYRTLQSTAPTTCNEWVGPLPERRVKVDVPGEVRGVNGSAALTINIDQSGR